mgnify:FL=1
MCALNKLSKECTIEMKSWSLIWFFSSILILAISCNEDKKIIRLLDSTEKYDIMRGAFKAGESHDRKFVPYLLKNTADPRISNSLDFKGSSVYQQKMIALRKIYNTGPPVAITYKPDSVVIKFYAALFEQSK